MGKGKAEHPSLKDQELLEKHHQPFEAYPSRKLQNTHTVHRHAEREHGSSQTGEDVLMDNVISESTISNSYEPRSQGKTSCSTKDRGMAIKNGTISKKASHQSSKSSSARSQYISSCEPTYPKFCHSATISRDSRTLTTQTHLDKWLAEIPLPGKADGTAQPKALTSDQDIHETEIMWPKITYQRRNGDLEDEDEDEHPPDCQCWSVEAQYPAGPS